MSTKGFMAMLNSGSRFAQIALLALAALSLGGCATSGNPKDPLEGVNRAMYGVHEGLDKVLLKPVAKGYDWVMPEFAQTGVSNFFSNLADLQIGVNNLLQGKPVDAASDIGRLVVNSTVGVLGLFDVATKIGLEKHEEDFGQTMGKWGIGPGPYMFIPILGPRDVRDTAGVLLDVYVYPVTYIDDVAVRNSLYALFVVKTRADLLPADKVIEEAALDKYAYIRDAYLQRRLNQVYDGNPPPSNPDDY